MKIIGLLGGMSWESTVPYYRGINRCVNERLGGMHSAKIVLNSVDFAELGVLHQRGTWEEAARILVAAARSVERAGADCLVLATNTLHKVAPEIEIAISIPLLHIVDATAQAVHDKGISAVGLLGTRFTMEENFYRARLERHGLSVVIPDSEDRQIVDRVIFAELCHGRLLDKSRSEYHRAIDSLIRQGAKGVILGCTEISMLVRPGDAAVPLFDTTEIHARAAADWALNAGAGSTKSFDNRFGVLA